MRPILPPIRGSESRPKGGALSRRREKLLRLARHPFAEDAEHRFTRLEILLECDRAEVNAVDHEKLFNKLNINGIT